MKRLSVGPDPNYIIEEEGKIFRRIAYNTERRWKRFPEFIRSNDFKLLTKAGFIPEHDQLVVMDDEIYLPVKRVIHLTNQSEWTQKQTIEATLLSVRLNIFLQMIESEFRAIDCHLGNVTYLYSKPLYIDIGSFSDIRFDMIKDHLGMDIKRFGIEFKDDLFYNYNLLLNYKPTIKTTEWDNYDKSTIKNISEIHPLSGEEKLINEWIDKVKPGSVFDAGSNAGRLSRQIAIKNIDVVSADCSELSCNRNRETAKYLDLKITTAFLDLNKPGGWRERLRCDAALASSITHHLYRHGMNWQQQAALWDEIAGKYLFIEFIDREDIHVKQWKLDAEYTYTEFRNSLKNWELESQATPESKERKWCLFKRKGKLNKTNAEQK